jgi:hypothetical protein
MSPQDPNRGTDLPGRESAEKATPMRDERRQGAAANTDGSTGDSRKPGRWPLGPAVSFQVSDGHSALRSNPRLIGGAVAVIGLVSLLGLAAAGGWVFAALKLFSLHRQGPAVAAGLQPTTPTEPPAQIPAEPDAGPQLPVLAAEKPVADLPNPFDQQKPADLPMGADPPKPADILRVNRAVFDKIQWQMPSQAIERILGKGESVDYSLVPPCHGFETG